MRRGQRGAALAMVVLLLAAVVAGFYLFGRGLMSHKRLATQAASQQIFDAVHLALTNFVLLNKRLPCPANGAATTGLENVSGSDCSTPTGPVPWTTLGLQRSEVTDPYGRLLSYRVYDGATGFTQSSGFALADCLELDDTTTTVAVSACNPTTHENVKSDFLSGKGLTVSDLGVSKTGIAYVLISHGPTGFGANLVDPTVSMTAPTSGGKEQVNASDSSTYWIIEWNDMVSETDTSHFDDIVSYRSAVDLLNAARQSGRPWPLKSETNSSTVTLGGTSGTATGTGVGMTIRSAASTARYICRLNQTPEGIAPCLLAGLTNDALTTLGNEYLEFEFRVKRRYLMARLTDFRTTGVNVERAKFTFFNGSTQVYQVVKSSCSNANNVGARFTIDPGAEFTKVQIAADDTSATTDFGVASVTACKVSDAALCSLAVSDSLADATCS